MPKTKEWWTNVPPSVRRSPWFQAVCRRLGLNPDVHRDRLDAITYALRLAAEEPVTDTEPLASSVTEVLVAVDMLVQGEHGAMPKLMRAHAKYRQILDEQ